MYGMPQQRAVGRDHSTAVTVLASVVAVLAAVGIYLHPGRAQECATVEFIPGPSPCDLVTTPLSLQLLIGLAVAATAVALGATVCGLVGDWKCYRRSH